MAMQGFQNSVSQDDDVNDFPTPPWATRAFIEHIMPDDLSELTVWEPACNRGHMVSPLQEYFGTVIASDKHDYGAGYPQIDFLEGPTPMDHGMKVDWIITNPPFKYSKEFVLRALSMDVEGVAMFVRGAWIEGGRRYNQVLKPHPPAIYAPFVERVRIVRGRIEPGSTQMPYAWLMWTKHTGATKLLWIPPCKEKMEREDDYPNIPTDT